MRWRGGRAAPPASGVVVDLGRTVAGEPVRLDLLAGAHIAVQGQTRSGKSVLAYSLLGQLAGRSDVLVCGVDPSAILLAPWAETGASVALGQDDMRAALEVVAAVKRVADERIEQLPAAGVDAVREVSETCPLVVLVLEEYAGILEAAADFDAVEGLRGPDRIEPRFRRAVRQLVAQSAKAGVRVLVMTQRAEAATLGGEMRSNLGTRVTLRVDNQDSVRMLHPTAPDELIEQVPRFAAGVAIVEAPELGRLVVRGPLVEFGEYAARVRTLRAPASCANAAPSVTPSLFTSVAVAGEGPR